MEIEIKKAKKRNKKKNKKKHSDYNYDNDLWESTQVRV